MEINEWLIELGGVENGYFKRNYYVTRQEAYQNGKEDAYIKKLGTTDVYRTIFEYEHDDLSTCLMRADLCFDLDKEIKNSGDFKQVLRDTLMIVAYIEEELFIEREYIQVYFSGSKGFHIVLPFELLGLETSKDLAEKYKVIATKINRETIYKTLDMKIYEHRRLFRIVNTINSKTGLYKVPVAIDALYKMTYEDIQAYASEPKESEIKVRDFNPKTKRALERILLLNKVRIMKRRHPKTIIAAERQDLLPCVQKLLAEGVGTGGRNNTCVAIASSLAQSGIEKEEATDMLLAWNDLNAPPLPSAEIVRTVNSAFSMAESGRGYGCAFFKENDCCVGDTCKLY